MELVDLFNELINYHNVTLLCVIHENPGSEEEPMMKKAFQECKGQIVPYTDKNGIPRRDSIVTIEDVYKILFKTNKLD